MENVNFYYNTGDKVSFDNKLLSSVINNSIFVGKTSKFENLILNLDTEKAFICNDEDFKISDKKDLNKIRNNYNKSYIRKIILEKRLLEEDCYINKFILNLLTFKKEDVVNYTNNIFIPSVCYYLKNKISIELFSKKLSLHFNFYKLEEISKFFNIFNIDDALNIINVLNEISNFPKKNFGENEINTISMCLIKDINKEIAISKNEDINENFSYKRPFNCQVKSRDQKSSSWQWPPVHNELVFAFNKEHAKEIFEKNIESNIPKEVYENFIKKDNYLVFIKEIDENSRQLEYFKQRICKFCGCQYKIIDYYNNGLYTPPHEFCSNICRDQHIEEYGVEQKIDPNAELNYTSRNVGYIYKITNKKTNKSYIGQTKQVFTLRWYQHFYHNKKETKFHKEIESTNIKDWEFSIIEMIKTNAGRLNEIDILEREKFWILHYDSIENGYNSLIPKA